MTAPLVGSPAVGSASPRNAVGSGSPESSVPGHFDHQLHAARQRNAPREPDPTPMGPNAPGRHQAPQAQELDSHRAASHTAPSPDEPDKAAAGETSDAPTSATAGTPAVAGTPPAAVAQADLAETKAPAEPAEPDDQAASALAGAMLALIGPAVAGVLRPALGAGKTGDASQGAKSTPIDAAATSLLQLDPSAAAAATNVNALPEAMVSMLGKVDGLLLHAASDKDPSLDGLAQAVATTATPATTAPTLPPVLHLQSPVGSQAFAQDLGQQVAWLGGQNIKQARIRLHPEELGSLDVKVSVTHGRVDVVFSAQHPGAVLAVQQSLPQLDHMLAQHGLSLGHAEVGQHDRGDRHGSNPNGGSDVLDEIGEIHGAALSATSGTVSLLDAFA